MQLVAAILLIGIGVPLWAAPGVGRLIGLLFIGGGIYLAYRSYINDINKKKK